MRFKVVWIMAMMMVDFIVGRTWQKETLVGASNYRSKTEERDICQDKECMMAAATIKSSVDTSKDPCEGFHQFACGGFMAHSQRLSEPQTNHDIVRRKNTDILYQALMHDSQKTKRISHHNFDAEDKAKMFFKSCMNGVTQEDVLTVQSWIDQAGGWQLSGKFNPDMTLHQIISTMHNTLGVDAFFSIDPGKYYNGTAIWTIRAVHWPFGDSQLGNMSTYASWLVQTYPGSVPEHVKHKVQGPMEKVLYFQNSLRNMLDKVIDDSMNNQSIEYFITHSMEVFHTRSIEDLNSQFPLINWEHFIKESLQPLGMVHKLPSMVFEVRKGFLPALHQLITSYMSNNTGLQILHNYMAWRIMDKSFSEDHAEVQHCFFKTQHSFQLVLLHLLARANGMENTEGLVKQTEEMVDILKQGMEEILSETHWMTPPSRLTAKKKLHELVTHVGYPKDLISMKSLNYMYRDFHVFQDGLSKNRASARIHYWRSLAHWSLNPQWERKSLGGSPLTFYWGNTVFPKADYYYSDNMIIMRLSTMQPPLTWSSPMALAYGTLGIIAAREVSKAFDNIGQSYGSNGEKNDIFDNTTMEGFSQQHNCFGKQYSTWRYFEGVAVEDYNQYVADSIALPIAWRGYQLWLQQGNKKNQQLPGLDFSNEQLFYLGYAMSLCEDKKQISSLVPSDFRFLGPLLNDENFAKVWQCKPGTPMNPEEKCKTW